ncbi:MAG: hypothetical protein RLZZ127_1791 [Planctomycetota bacterium]
MLLAFALGVVARLVKSDLQFPKDLGTMLSIFLLFAIGLKGGAALGQANPSDLLWPVVAALVLGIVIPLWTYPVVRRLGGFGSEEAAALVAHYGSTSAVTFLAALTFLESLETGPEGFMPGLLAIMEVPGIVVALLLAKPVDGVRKPLGPAIWHVLTGKSLLLLIGGMAIGWLADPKGMHAVSAFFVDPFRGVLCLFLLELGMIAAERLRDLRAHLVFLIAFGIAAPVINGCLGVLAGHLAGLSAPGATVLGVLAASASYIAAPAAVRMALPAVNPGPALAAALGVTFPFNLIVGLPLYYEVAIRL